MGALSPTIHADLRFSHSLRCHTRGRKRRSIFYFPAMSWIEGAAMCDEYYDARMKAFWRALADADELENEEKEDEPIVKPIAIEPLEPFKAKPRALVR